MLVNWKITVTTMIGPERRQQDAPEDLEEARAVDLRGADELVRERLVVVAEEQRGEAEAVDHMHEDEARRSNPAMPSMPRMRAIGISTIWNGMKQANSISPNTHAVAAESATW